MASVALLIIGCGEQSGKKGTNAVTPERLRLQQRWKIGSAMSGGELLSTVGKVLVGPAGGMIVAQPMEDHVLVFNADGTARDTVGRRGQGPGEFRWLGPIGLRGDTLWVNAGGRLDFFSLDGKLLSSRSWTPADVWNADEFFAPVAPVAFEMASDGSSLVIPGEAVIASGSGPKVGVRTGVSRIPILRINPRGEIADTVVWWAQRWVQITVGKKGKTYFMSSPFDDSDLLGLLPDGRSIVLVKRSETGQPSGRHAFRVSVIHGLEDTVMEKSVPYDPIRLSNQDIAWALRQQAIYPQGDPAAPDTSEFRSKLEKAGMIPKDHYPVTALAVGQDGSIWLRREDHEGRPVSWLELGPGGALRGEITLPSAQKIVAARDGQIVALERDSLGVPYLVCYDVTP